MFDEWWPFARANYLDLDGDALPQAVSLYYDPILDVHHKLPVFVAVINALYLAPQRPDDARAAVRSRARHARRARRRPAAVIGERNTGVALLLARRVGARRSRGATGDRGGGGLRAAWYSDRGEFTWGFGLQ